LIDIEGGNLKVHEVLPWICQLILLGPTIDIGHFRTHNQT